MTDIRKDFGSMIYHEAQAYLKPQEGKVSEGVGDCYSPEHIEDYLFGGKKIDNIVDGMTYNLTGTHLKDILQNYRKLWVAQQGKRAEVDLDVGTLAFDKAYKLEQDEYLPTEEIKRILQKVAKAWGLIPTTSQQEGGV